MTTKDLALLAGRAVPQTAAEQSLTTADRDVRALAGLLLDNRALAQDCEEHDWMDTPDGARQRGEVDRPFQCRLCGFRTGRAFLIAYEQERPDREELRRFHQIEGAG